MPTPKSSATSYASVADAIDYCDSRTLGDLCGDAGARIGEAGLLSDAKMQAALAAASGQVEESCTAGNRYTPVDLNALTGMSRARLKELTVWLAVGKLMRRRNQLQPQPEMVKEAEAALDRVRKGEAVFGLLEQQEAGGGADSTQFYPDEDVAGRTPVRQARRLFGTRDLTSY